MELRILGPLQVVDGDRDLIVGGPRERALLVALACRAGDAVGSDGLVDAVWGEQPPRSAPKLLQNHVLHLRKALGAEAIETRDGGYALSDVASLDVTRFETLVHQGRDDVSHGAHNSGADRFRAAIALWRGTPFSEVADWPPAAAEVARLSEVRRTVEEEAIDARLELGQASACVADLEALVAAEPLREHRWVQLMLALYRSGRQADALRAYQRARTTLAEELGVEPGPELRATEQAVIAHDPALESAHEADLRAARATNRHLRLLVVAVAVALVVALVAGTIAVRQRHDADREASRARHSAALAEAARISTATHTLPPAQSDLALLLGVEGRRQFPSNTADAGLASALARTPAGLTRMLHFDQATTFTSVSPDGRMLAAPSGDGTIRLYDLATGRPMRTLARPSASGCSSLVAAGSLCAPAAAFSPDGRFVAGGGFAAVTLWRVATGEAVGEPFVPGGSIVSAVFDPVDADRMFTVGNDGQVTEWSLRDSSRPVGVRFRFPIDSSDTPEGFVSADGRYLAAGGLAKQRTDVWDLASHRLLFEAAGAPGPFSPDSRTVATAPGGSVVLYDVTTGAARGAAITGLPAPVPGMTFSSDGRKLAVGDLGPNATVHVFDVASGAAIGAFGPLHHPVAYPAAFLRDGRLVTSGSEEAAVWNVDSPSSPLVRILRVNGYSTAQFDPNGDVLTVGDDGRVLVWDPTTATPRGQFLGGRLTTRVPVAFSGDGARVATGGSDGTFSIWDVASGRKLSRVSTGRPGWVAVAWDPRRPIVVTVTTAHAPAPEAQDASAALWDVSNPSRPAPTHSLVPATRIGFATFSFSGDGTLLALAAGTGGSATVFDVSSGSVVHTIRADYGVVQGAFVATSSLALASADYGGSRLTRWDTRTWRAEAAQIATAPDGLALFHGDERIVTPRLPELGSARSEIELWDRASLQPFGEPIPLPTREAFLTFANAAGTKVAVGTTDGNASVIDLDPASWQITACAVAGRNLTRAEWNEYFPGRHYAVTCLQWPPG